MSILLLVLLSRFSMHARMMIWKNSLTQHEWDNMRVVVAGNPSARNMELHMQYFAKLLVHTHVHTWLRGRLIQCALCAICLLT